MQQQPIVIQQHINAWWTLAAILATLLSGAIGAIVGSVITLRKQKQLADENNARERKMNIFRVLMATRSFILRFRLEHVSVLNTIAIEFGGHEKVMTALSAYLFEMNSSDKGEELWRRREEKFFDLLCEISKAIGYKHDKEYLRNTSYAPSGYGDEAEDWFKVRKWLTEIAEGKKPIPVWLINETPVQPEVSSAEAGK
jgi:uncharacterized protein DUF6680